MSLKIWMPLNGDLRNYGTTKLPSPSRTQVTYGNGKMGISAACVIGWHLDEEILENTWSVAMWVKPSSLGQYNNILFSKNVSSSSDCQIYFSIMSNNALNLGLNNHSSDVTGTASFANGTWYHVAATYDGTTATIYLNGQELNHKTVSSTYSSDKLNINLNGRSSNATNTTYTGWFGSSYNDFRLYDNCISAAEVRELARGLVLHYKLDGTDIPNENLGNTSADYHNFSDGYSKAAGSWGGDAGTVTFHHSGGYAGLPYKELHKTATGTGGIYSKTADDIVLESNTTYTMSCWIKASRNFRPIHYSFNINRGVGNVYITYGSSFDLTTEWQFFSKTFTTTEDQAGSYGEMSIIYDDNETDYYVYYSGFKIEKGTTATRWTPPGIQYTTIQDSSGYNNNAISNGSQPVTVDSDTPKYSTSTKFISGSRIAMPVASSTCLPTQAITISIWYKSSAGTTRFLSCTESGGWNFEVNSSKASFPFYINGKGYARIISTKNFYSDNQWHMITVTYDGISTGKWYWDGVLDNTITVASGWENLPIKYNTATPLTLGAEAQTIASPIAGTFVGNLSDFRIYCTALDADAVKELYSLGAKIDKNNNTFTKEFREKPDGINKLYKTAIYETANLIEHESGPSLSPIEWSYQPAANTNNASWGGVYADFSNVKDLGIPITVHCEYDISWNNVAPAAEGAFLARVQGSLAAINGSYDYWQGTNYLIPDSYSMTSNIRNNPTGTKHFSFTKTIPADWFQSYYLARIGFRVNYCDGNGTVSCSNVKITYQFDNTKIHSGAFITNQLIEN